MDKARIAAIWTELKEYGDETQLGFPLSTIKVGELAELISEHAGQADTIERLTKERDDALAEVDRLKGDLDEARGEIDWLSRSNNLLRSQVDHRATSSTK